jgi:hypothetical protein
MIRAWAWMALPLLLHAASWPAKLAVLPAGETAFAGRSIASSSTLRVAWAPPDAVPAKYVLTVAAKRTTGTLEIPGDAAEALITDLKAGTGYRVSLRACLDADCSESLDAQSVTARTEDEYWSIQSTANSFSTVKRIVPDGNVGSYAFRYGPWAGPELDGKIQLYYNPMQREEKGIKIGELVAPVADSIEAASEFRGVPGFGVLRVCDGGPPPPNGPPPNPACTNSASLAASLDLFQAVPLSPEMGGKVRLYFEALGVGGRTRILSLDSQDGYIGRDFHPGPETICATLQDLSPGGPCEPALVIGVDTDGERGNPNLLNARQFKIGYPTLDSWVWNGAPGTFMWFTTEWSDRRCSDFGFNAAYAVWSGERWVVQYGENGCPKLLPGAQAPMPVHLGGGRYKLYFNIHPRSSPLKPMRLLYADPDATGDPGVVDFEDWEPLEEARELHYLWPDGTELDDLNESQLDDYMIFAPTSHPKRLIIYSNMGAPATFGQISPPVIGSAVLINP